MGRSLYSPGTQPVIEDWERRNELRHAPSARTFRMFRRDGEFFYLRYQTGPKGERINVVEKRIDYVLGSGNHARSYLHRTPDGRLLGLPVAWYTAKGGYWGMAPGYDRADHVDYRREINENCRFCHTAYPREQQKSPEAVDCQRCHGPGAAHAAAPSRGNIVSSREMDLCLQCHLQSTSQRAWMTRVPGRAAFSYRPGEALAGYARHIDDTNGAFEVNHSGYRLLRSACYKASQGKLTCLTCHDPHARGVKFACSKCHQNARHTGDCVSCHMPKRAADDAPHVTMTDHLIAKRPLKTQRLKLAPQDAAVPQTSPAALLNTRGEALYRAGKIDGAILILRQAIAENPDIPEAHINLGVALTANGDRKGAEQAFREAIRIAPEYGAAHRNLALLLRSGYAPLKQEKTRR